MADEDPLAAAGAAYKDAVRRHQRRVAAARRAEQARADSAAELNKLRPELHQLIAEAGRARRRPAEISKLTGLSPERVRQILRAFGVDPFDDIPPKSNKPGEKPN